MMREKRSHTEQSTKDFTTSKLKFPHRLFGLISADFATTGCVRSQRPLASALFFQSRASPRAPASRRPGPARPGRCPRADMTAPDEVFGGGVGLVYISGGLGHGVAGGSARAVHPGVLRLVLHRPRRLGRARHDAHLVCRTPEHPMRLARNCAVSACLHIKTPDRADWAELVTMLTWCAGHPSMQCASLEIVLCLHAFT